MAANTSPIFGLTPVIWVAKTTTAVTTRDGSGTETSLGTGGTNGTRIEEIVVKSETDLADSVVIIWIHDGSNDFMFDEIDCGDPAAGSTTAAAYRARRVYDNLVLPSGYSLKFTITVAPTTGSVVVFALGASY